MGELVSIGSGRVALQKEYPSVTIAKDAGDRLYKPLVGTASGGFATPHVRCEIVPVRE